MSAAGREAEPAEAEGAQAAVDASTNTPPQPQAQSPQMAASGAGAGAGGAVGGAKWRCETCTYENFPLSRKCTMCRTPKPLLGEDILRLQDDARALPQHDTEVEGVADRLKPLRIASPVGQAGASCQAKWPCPTCTYENWPRSLKCAMCGAPPEPRAKPQGVNEVSSGQNASANEAKRRNNPDWLWLQACIGVVEGDVTRVEAYLAAGGDPARALAPHEAALLDRASAFDAGHTLVHLAIRFQREDILATLLSRISGGGPGLKRSPSYIAPDVAAAIRRHVAASIRYKKGAFPCRYLNEFCTFALPAEIEELPVAIQEQLFSELLDRDAQQTLEAEPPLINWSLELCERLGSRLHALWNRSAGDCLLDAVSQCSYGVFDRRGALRAALAESLLAAGDRFYERWAAWERAAATSLHYAPEEAQLRTEWARQVSAAARPGTALHQLHVFALAHVARRPIIVYGVNVVNSFRGEALGYANFQGIYLPLLWEPALCSKSPLAVGYTRGHFSALVPIEPYCRRHAYICRDEQEENEESCFLPLTDCDGKLLPVHFLTVDEMGDEEGVVRRWLSACVTGGGTLCARQHLHPRPLLVAQLLEEWLNHYRRLAQQVRGPFPPRLQPAHAHAHAHELSSDADTDDE